MAFFDFRVAGKTYEVKDVTDSFNRSRHDALMHHLSSEAKLFTITRCEEKMNKFVAAIVGDECRVQSKNEKRHVFVVHEDYSSLPSDKIAIMRVLQYLNNEEYKK